MEILDVGQETKTLMVEIHDSDSDELKAILVKHFPDWLELFARKNSEYGGGSAFDLGPRGQFSDMYRKMIKLKRAMWDEDESVLKTEGVDEIILDLIGHCFLTLEMRRREREARDRTQDDRDDEEPPAPRSGPKNWPSGPGVAGGVVSGGSLTALSGPHLHAGLVNHFPLGAPAHGFPALDTLGLDI